MSHSAWNKYELGKCKNSVSAVRKMYLPLQ
jgi:hypothetical protein